PARLRPSVRTGETGRLVAAEREGLAARPAPAWGVHNRADLGRRVRPLPPGRAGAEGEVGELGLRLDRDNRLEERLHIDAVANSGRRHALSFLKERPEAPRPGPCR